MSDELEPLTDDVASLLRSIPAPSPVSAAARAQVLERIGHTLVAAPPLAAGAGAGAAAGTAGAGAATSLKAKVVAGLLLAGAIPAAVGGFVYGRATAPTPDPQVVIREVPVVVPTAKTEPAPPPAGIEQPDAPPTPPPGSRSGTDPTPRVTAPDGRPLIEAARTALLKSDAPRALALLAEHAQRFPKSQLAEERAALEIQALVLSGDVARAKTAATAFKARWKNSVFSSVADAVLESP